MTTVPQSSFWQKYLHFTMPAPPKPVECPPTTLPFFSVENTSLNLQAVAHMANIIVHCTRPHCHPNRIELLCYSAPISVTVIATKRQATELTFSLSVSVNKEAVVSLKNLKVLRNTYTAAAQICGIIYRKAVVLAPLTSESVFKADTTPSCRLITTAWPPIRIASLTVTLFMQTYNGSYATVTITPRNTSSFIATFCHSADSKPPTNLHVNYKAQKVTVVITCVNPPQKSVHVLPLPNKLEFLPSTNNTFRWKNSTEKDVDNLQTHAQQFWRLLVGILS